MCVWENNGFYSRSCVFCNEYFVAHGEFTINKEKRHDLFVFDSRGKLQKETLNSLLMQSDAEQWNLMRSNEHTYTIVVLNDTYRIKVRLHRIDFSLMFAIIWSLNVSFSESLNTFLAAHSMVHDTIAVSTL